MSEIAPKFLDFIKDSPVVAHNGFDFDFPFINFELTKLGLPQISREQQLDSIVIARNRVFGPKAYTLDALAKWFGVPLTARADAHGALIDAEILAKVFLELENTSPAPDESSLTGLSTAFTIFIVILSILGTLIVAVLAEWLFRRQTAGAAAMIKERTGALIGTGIVGAIAAPIAVILLICFGITLPVAGGVAFALFAITAVANGFAGASLFKLVFPAKFRLRFPRTVLFLMEYTTSLMASVHCHLKISSGRTSLWRMTAT